MKRLIPIVIFLTFFNLPAYGFIQLRASVGSVFSTPEDNFNTSYSSIPGFPSFSGALELEDILPLINIEGGATLHSRKFLVGSTLEIIQPQYQFFLMGRVNIMIFSVAAGIYLGKPNGTMTIIENGVPKVLTYAEAQLKDSEVGIIGSAKLSLPILPVVTPFLEARLTKTVFNAATTGTFRFQDLQLYLGAQLGI